MNMSSPGASNGCTGSRNHSPSGSKEDSQDRNRVVLSQQFCSNLRACGSSKPAAPSLCCIPSSLPQNRCGKQSFQLAPRIVGPFQPRTEFRELAYQPLRRRKGVQRKISSNTLHGVESVNDLRSWSFSKEERRKHYLEYMAMSSETGELEPEEDEVPHKHLAAVQETEVPIPHLRKKEEAEVKKRGKSVEKVIAEEYHKQEEKKAKSRADEQSKKDNSNDGGSRSSASSRPAKKDYEYKEVQTPKMSISNLLEELSEEEQMQLYDAMKQRSKDEEEKRDPSFKARDDEIRKLRDRIKELENEYDKLQDQKDDLARQVKDAHPPQKDEDIQTEEAAANKTRTETVTSNSPNTVTINGPEPVTSQSPNTVTTNGQEPVSASGLKTDTSGASQTETSSVPKSETSSDPKTDTSSASKTVTSSAPGNLPASSPNQQPSTAGSNDCAVRVLQCEYALLEYDNIELQRQLTNEIQRSEQLAFETQALQDENIRLHEGIGDLETTLQDQQITDTQHQMQIRGLMARLDEARVEKFQQHQMIRSLEQEVNQLQQRLVNLAQRNRVDPSAFGQYPRPVPPPPQMVARPNPNCGHRSRSYSHAPSRNCAPQFHNPGPGDGFCL